MKKFVIFVIVLFVLIPALGVLGLKIGWSSFIEPKVRQQIMAASKDQGYELNLKPLALKSWFVPVRLLVQDVTLQNSESGLDVKIPLARLVFSPASWSTDLSQLRGRVSLKVVKPQITLTQTMAMQEKSVAQKGTSESKKADGAAPFLLPPLGLDVEVQEAQVSYNQQIKQGYNQVAFMGLNLKLQVPQLGSENPAVINGQGSLAYKFLNTPFPIVGSAPLTLSANQWVVLPGAIKVSDLQMALGGMAIQVAGEQNRQFQKWQVVTEVPDLRKLQEGGLLPEGTWRGGLAARLDYSQEAGGETPLLSGTLRLKNVSGRLAQPIEKQGAQLSGGFASQGQVQFEYGKSLSKLNANIAGNLTPLDIFKPEVFHKKAKVPLTFSLQSSLKKQAIQISKLNIELAQIKPKIKGVLATGERGVSQFEIQLPKTNLKGLESILLPMKDYPAKGQLALDAKVVGDLQNPESLTVNAKSVDLNLISGVAMSDQEKGYSVKGPFSAQVKGQVVIANKDVQKAQLVGNINLDSMSMKLKNGIEKKPKQKLSLVFQGGKSGKLFSFKKFNLNTFFGSFVASGTVSNPLKPKLNISGKIENLNLKSLKSLMKSFANLPIQGLVQGDVKVAGVFDTKLGLEKSPLFISGKMLHNASLLKWTSPKTVGQNNESGKQAGESEADSGKTSSKSPEKPRPLLPEWPVVKTAKLAVTSKIDKIIFNDLTATDFVLQGRYDQGILTGQMSMNRLFSGQLVLKDIQSDLYKVPTYIQGTAVTKGLDLKQAVTWGVPEQKDLVKGSLTGGFKVKAPFPSHADPFTKTTSSGSLNIQGFEVSTLKLDQMINGLLAKIPGLKDKKKVQTQDVKALFKTKYTFKDGVLTYKDTDFLTPENHQLLANGTLHVDKSIRMQGKLFVSGVKVKDRLQSCLLDPQGRLEVPVEYVGSIVQPKVSNSAKAIEKIGGKYLECEKKSQLAKAKTEVKKEADKVLKKEGKKLEEKLKGKLKDIF